MKKRIIITLILILGFTTIAYSQECGPSCPVCSGGGESSGSLLAAKSLLLTGIYIPKGEEETGVIKLKYGIFNWMDMGLGYTIKAEKPIWSLRISPISEDEEGWRPGLILGTGSVQTGGSDQSVFIQLTKSWELTEWFALRLAGGGASLIPDFKEIYGIAGITLSIYEKFSPFASFDGKNFHYGLAWIPFDWLTIGGLLVESEYFAISLGFRYSFAE